jgi:hypothetical protein
VETVNSCRARVAGLTARGASPERIAEARVLLAEAKATRYIRDLVADKVLTPQGIARIAAEFAAEEATP